MTTPSPADCPIFEPSSDDTLRAAAAQGQLHTRAQVKAHAERLAQNPKALDMLTDFLPIG